MNPDRKRLRRVYGLIGFMAVWAVAIVARLWLLQIVESKGYAQEASRQQQRTIDVPPPRGVILDTNGKVLASTIKVDSVFADPLEIVNPDSTAAALAPVLGISSRDLTERLVTANSRYVSIQRRILPSVRREIEALGLQGIHFEEDARRLYPNRQLGAQMIGYVGEADQVGLGGIEYKYDKLLKGEPGKTVVLVDARSKSFHRVEKEPVAGATLTTTIDEHIQSIIERQLAAASTQVHKTGGISIVAMNPRSGAVLGMGTYPSFNPNDVARSRPEDRINRAVNLVYEPGSTFKIATVAAALEEGLTNKNERIDCLMGSIILANHRIRDHKPFGVLSVSEIMQFSSDVGVIKLGLRLGDERLSSYIDRLGFGHPTGVDLPGEEKGIVRPTSQWSKISIGAVSMGQEIGVTPLQILSMVSAVANGGTLYRPYVVSKIEHPRDGTILTAPRGRQVLHEETVKQLQEMLEFVVTDGTAKAAGPEGYRAAGKTGTAQKIDPKTRTYSSTKYVASFAGYAPASNPSVALIVVVDEPTGAYHGGEVAAPIFKRLAEQILQYRGVPHDLPDYAPHYAGAPVKPTLPPPRLQPPAKNWANVNAGPVVEEPVGNIDVPDFSGKSLRDAVLDGLKLGIRVRAIGSGRAVDQQPPAGSKVNAGAQIDVLFVGVQ